MLWIRKIEKWCAWHWKYCNIWCNHRTWLDQRSFHFIVNCCLCSICFASRMVFNFSLKSLSVWSPLIPISNSELWRSHWLRPKQKQQSWRFDRWNVTDTWTAWRRRCIHQHQVHGAHVWIVFFELINCILNHGKLRYLSYYPPLRNCIFQSAAEFLSNTWNWQTGLVLYNLFPFNVLTWFHWNAIGLIIFYIFYCLQQGRRGILFREPIWRLRCQTLVHPSIFTGM